MVSPAPGTRLPATAVTFTWSQATGANAYQLWIGTKIAAQDLFSANLTGTSVTATNLPSNGSPIYVRLFSKVNGAWQSVDYSYVALAPAPAEILSPAPGSKLTSGAISFNWSPGYGTTGYTLCVGTGSGQCDVSQWSGTGLSATVNGVPTNGATLYATLTSAFGTTSENVYYTYVAAGAPQVSALAVPDHGTGVSRIFRFVYDWKAGSAPFRFIDLRIGASADDATTCALTYDTAAGSLGFSGDTSGEALGANQPLTNGNCTVFVQTSSASQTATQLLLALEMQFASKGSTYGVFTREWSGSSATAPPQNATAWQQVGTWKVADESWPVVDRTKYATASAIARRAYLAYGYDYHYWVNQYSPLGTYFNSQNDYGFYLHGYPLNAEGFPIPNGPNYNMVTLAEYGLCRWSRYAKGLESAVYFLATADKLVSLTQPDGSLIYLFPAVGQNPPWTSGMAQGLTLSIFERAFALTKNPKYLAAGKLILRHMVTLKSSSGDRSDLGDVVPTLDGYSTFEEAPQSPWAQHILNGFEFAMIGLHDWSETTGDLEAKAYFDSGVETLEKTLPYWDIGGWTNYDLFYLIGGDRDLDPAAVEYQGLHIALQDAFGQITGDPRFYAYRDRWINQIATSQVKIDLPAGVSVSPNSGSGSSATFQFLFRSPGSVNQMGRVTAKVNTTATAVGGCAVTYDPLLRQVMLQGTGAPVSGRTGVKATLSVPECSLDLSGTSVSFTTTDVVLTAPLTFSSSMAGQKNVYLAALNAANNPAASFGFANFGTWNVCSSNCPLANLLSSQKAVSLGTVGVGSSSSIPITITNPGSTEATLGSVSITGAAFAQTNTCSGALQAGGQCVISVTYSPSAVGANSGTLTITHNLSAGALVVPLTGTGTAAALTASPSPLNFGYSVIGQATVRSITVVNYTTSGLTISAIEISPGAFTKTDDCTGQSLAPAGVCTVLVTVDPSAEGDSTGSVTIVSSGSSNITIPLAVTGVQPTLPHAATPVFSLSAGTYTSVQTVSINDATAGSLITYTTDGTPPTPSSTPYSGPITVSASETLQSIATAGGHSPSAIANATYLITFPAPAPLVSPAGGSYTVVQTVTLSASVPGARIYFTTDGTQPTSASTLYSGPITVFASETVQAIAIAPSYAPSAVSTAQFTITLPPGFMINGNNLSVVRGATTQNSSTITVTPTGGFTGQITMSAAVTSSPSGAVDPPTLSFGATTPINVANATAVTATLTISTTPANSAGLARPSRPGSGWLAGEGAISLCILLFGFRNQRRRWQNLLGLAFLLVITAGLMACGGGSQGLKGTGGGGTTPGSYVITVTGSSGSLGEKTTLSLTVN